VVFGSKPTCRRAGGRSDRRVEHRFPPINYFGVTGINVTAHPGGQVLHDGMQIHSPPPENFTLQALLSRLGEVSAGALTPQLISVIDRSVRYTDALNPLVETMVIALSAVADVQNVPTARLLTNATGISVAFPSFVDAFGDFGDHFIAARDKCHSARCRGLLEGQGVRVTEARADSHLRLRWPARGEIHRRSAASSRL